MAKHDILLYNSASKGFTTNINSDTVRIKGSSDELLSIENSSGTKNLQIDTIGSNFTFNAPLTASGNFSGSLATTASFGRVVANRFAGDASQMTNTPISDGTVSSSAQLAVNISGSFDEGFTHSGAVSGSSTSTGSFGFATSTKYDSNINISGITNKIPANTISSSAQIASEISGAFDSGFEFTGTISGSSTSTGSFGKFIIGDKIINGDGQFLTNISYTPSTFSSSFQIASEISGAFDEGFTFGGGLDANQRFTASFVGVSGSAFAYANHSATTMSISSTCGSDFDYRLNDAITGGQIKGNSIGTGVWSSGPNRNDDQSGFAAVGTQNAYLSAGGYKAPKDETEKYDGTAWSISAKMSIENCTAAGFGTQNAAAIAGGQGDYDGTELYNGATYSDAGNMASQRRYGGSAGTQNAGLVFAGTSPSPSAHTDQCDTETFDGNAWSQVNNLNTTRTIGGSGGTQNAAILAGGYKHSPGAVQNATETWNGTNWTTVANLNTARSGIGGIGTQNHFIAGGGSSPSIVGITEEWNGTSWSETSDLSQVRSTFSGGQGGLGTAGILAGGQIGSPTATNTVEFWNDNSTTGSFGRVEVATKFGSGIDATGVSVTIPTGTVSGSAQIASDVSGSFTSGFTHSGEIKGVVGIGLSGVWSAVGSSPNTLRDYAASAGSGGGTVDASKSALMFGGRVSPASVTCTEEWDGLTWTETGDLITDRIQHGGFGTTEAAVAVGSAPYPTNTGTKTEEFNGTSWSEVTDIGTAAGGIYGMSAGTQNSGLIFNAVSSNAGASGTESYEYNGTNWTAGGDASVKHARGQMGGTQNSAVLFGGMTAASNTGETCTEEYNGTSFSTGGSLNVKHSEFGGDGASAANGLAVGDSYGNTEAGTNVARCTEAYNGDSWTVKTPLPFKMGSGEYQGTATKGIAFGGYWRFPNLNSGLALMPQNYEWDDESVAVMPNTGSFGKVNFASIGTAVNVTGMTNFKPDNTVSSSAQLAVNISGSFDEGFQYGGALTANQNLTASFVGVSGSAFAYANHSATTMSISSTSGSDFDYRLADGITAGKIKGNTIGTGNWTAATARTVANASGFVAGTQTALLSGAGYDASGPDSSAVYKYNGAAWSLSAALIKGRSAAGSAGTQNAALIFGGGDNGNTQSGLISCTEKYNGSTWSETGNLPAAGKNTAGTGTQNAAIQAGRYCTPGSSPGAHGTETYLFDGNAWSDAGADLITAGRRDAAFGGTYDAAVSVGGSPYPTGCRCVENWNGSTWSSGTIINTGRIGASFAGTQNSAIIFGHQAPYSGITEEWNGTSWTETNDLIKPRAFGGCTAGGLQDSAIAVSGYCHPTNVTDTEHWDAGSSTTGSFGLLDVSNYIITNTGELENQSSILTANSVSGSAQLSVNISGSFDEGFNYAGSISGSSTSSGSFARFSADNYNLSAEIDVLTASISNLIPDNLVSSSAQIASDISGSFDEGFNYVGNLSGSYDTTGSFNLIHALEYPNIDASAFLNHPTASGTVTGSSQLATDISGSFNEGFEFTGLISGSSTSTASFNNFISDKLVTKNILNNNGINVIPHVGNSFYDTRQFLPGSASLQLTSCGSCSDTSTNGYDAFDGQLSVGTNGILNISFQTSSFVATNTRGIQPGVWSAGPNMLLARAANMVGSSNSSIAIGGTQGAGSAAGCPEAQHFDGISWRQGGSITHYKYAGRPGSGAAAGQSENDAASYGFYTSAGHGADANNMYNGVVWTEGPKNPGGNSDGQGGAGCSAFSTVVFGGGTGTDEFNGTAWSEGGNLNQTRNNTFGFGSQNAAVAHSGNYNNGRYHTEHYDGTSWTAVNSSLLAHDGGDGGAYGTQNSAHSNKQGTDHQSYDGVTWSRTTDSSVTRFYAGISGNAQNAMMIGGRSPSVSDASVNTVEVFHDAFMSGSFLQTKKIASNYS